MKINMKLIIRKMIVPVCAIILFAACTTPKNISYLPETANGTTISMAASKGITFKENDRISIVVNTKSTELNNILNMPVNAQIIGSSEVQSLNQSQGISGYIIDSEGNIDFPLIGKIKAEILPGSHQAAGIYLQKSHQCYFCRQYCIWRL